MLDGGGDAYGADGVGLDCLARSVGELVQGTRQEAAPGLTGGAAFQPMTPAWLL